MKKSYTKSVTSFILLLFVTTALFAQTVVVLPGNGSTSGNGRAPQGSRKFINTKYIILASELTASGFTGEVKSVGWRWNVPSPPAAAVPVAQSTATSGVLKVFLKDTAAAATNMSGTFIDTSGAGYTKVIHGTINIPAGVNEINIDVPVGGPGTTPFIPIPGNAVLLIFVYTTSDAVLATPVGAPTVFCTNQGVGTMLLAYQSQTVGGTTGGVSVFRPETRFGTAPAVAVTLSGFKATYNSLHKKTLIQWSTNSEFNSRIFNIERSIDDGRNFETIGSVPAAGSSNALLHYQFFDPGAVEGTNFYRLKQIDSDNHFKYSNVVSIRIKEARNYSLYPNPANSFTLVNSANFTPAPVSIQLINLQGKIIKELKTNISSGQPVKLDFNDIGQGVYIIKISSNNGVTTNKKLVIL